MSSQPNTPPATPSGNSTMLNGRYRLLAIVASGGMATVYKAQDVQLNRLVAVKILRERYANDPQFVQRFREEATAAANLNHPNIVTIYDVGRDTSNGVERDYIVMEYLEGADLKTVLRDRAATGGATGQPININQMVDIARQICEGVGYAHRRGLAHCDMKPQNVIISPEGHAEVADFGISRAYTSALNEHNDVVWGTPQYFAPEQASGGAPTPASDVYSIGVMLYEMLSGRLPFQASDPQQLARLHMTAEPTPLHLLNSNVTLQLEAIVRRAMSKDPNQRYRDADQLARVLVSYLQQGQEQTLSGMAPVEPPNYTGPTSRTTSPTSVTPPTGRTATVNTGSASGQTGQTGQRTPMGNTGNNAAGSMGTAGVASTASQRRTAAQAAQAARTGRNTNANPRMGERTGVINPGSDNTATYDMPAEASGTDIVLWLLGALAVLAVLGLVPLWVSVYQQYNAPPSPVQRGVSVNYNSTSGTAIPTNTPGGTAVPPIAAPSVVNKPLDVARQEVEALKLNLRVTQEITASDTSQTQTLVFQQLTAVGTQLQPGQSIDIVISKPVLFDTVPGDLLGRMIDNTVSQTLRSKGWNVVVEETASFEPEGQIVAVFPPAGEKLAVNGTLTLTLSTGGRFDIDAQMPSINVDWVKFTRESYGPGQVIEFDVQWRATDNVGQDYNVAWYLLGNNGTTSIAQGDDRAPANLGNSSPTSGWSAGTVVVDHYQLTIPNNIPAGTYTVEIALYNGAGRLPITNAGQGETRNSLLILRTIQIL